MKQRKWSFGKSKICNKGSSKALHVFPVWNYCFSSWRLSLWPYCRLRDNRKGGKKKIKRKEEKIFYTVLDLSKLKSRPNQTILNFQYPSNYISWNLRPSFCSIIILVQQTMKQFYTHLCYFTQITFITCLIL